MSIILSFGKWGGFGYQSNWLFSRVCIGFISLMLIRDDADIMLCSELARRLNTLDGKGQA